MTRLQKAWETRRARYGASGGNKGVDQLPWCPAEMRGYYQDLRFRSKRLGASEARRIVEEEMARAR